LEEIAAAHLKDAPEQPDDSKKFDKQTELTQAKAAAEGGSDEKKVYEKFEIETDKDIKNNAV